MIDSKLRMGMLANSDSELSKNVGYGHFQLVWKQGFAEIWSILLVSYILEIEPPLFEAEET